jgi:Mg-chelatase subunit ChlD
MTSPEGSVDAAGSPHDAPRVDHRRHCPWGGRLVRTLRPQDRVLVVPFNAHLGTMTGPTNDGPTITQAIGVMRAEGGTALLDALRESTDLLKGMERRRALIVITDGYDEHSTTPIADVLSSAESAQITIYVVGIGGVAGISLRLCLRRDGSCASDQRSETRSSGGLTA